MTLMSDREIEAAIAGGDLAFDPPLPAGPQGSQQRDSPIQAASVDLHIGQVFLPDSMDSELGSADRPKNCHILREGETAVVQTMESLTLSRRIAAFGFPPSRVSFRGLLMTNPGHVDPGYQGRLRFAVINMGSEPIALERGGLIASLLMFRLDDNAVIADYRDRRGAPTTPQGEPIHEEDLRRLARDFLNVEKRAKKCAEDATRIAGLKVSVFTPLVTAAVALLVAALTVVGGSLFTGDLRKSLEVVDKRLSYIEKSRDLDELKKQLDELRSELSRLHP